MTEINAVCVVEAKQTSFWHLYFFDSLRYQGLWQDSSIVFTSWKLWNCWKELYCQTICNVHSGRLILSGVWTSKISTKIGPNF